MNQHRKLPTKLPTNRVDWSDPRLESLLQRSESWQLDNRGSHPALAVELHLGWAGGEPKAAMMVWQKEHVVVLETSFSIPQGEHVRIDKPFGDGYQTRWGTVVESRVGLRPGDEESGTQVHWVHVR
jgi:hypothetical protein